MTKKGVVALVVPSDLPGIADSIHAEWGKGIESQFAIGHLLVAARELLVADDAFGKWLAEQNFGFTTKTANNLRRAAEREGEVRDFIAARKETSVTGRDIGLVYAMDLLASGKRTQGGTDEPRDREEAREDIGFVAFRSGVHRLLGWTVDEDGSGRATKNGLAQLPEGQLVELRALVEELAAAFGAAMQARRAAAA